MRNDVTDLKSEKVNAALKYLEYGWQLVPLHPPLIGENGVCSCGEIFCSKDTEHPQDDWWTSNKVTDSKAVEGWWDTWPEANVGLVLGEKSDMIVLEITGSHGLNNLKQYVKDKTEIPNTRFIKNGNNNQLLFKHPGFSIPGIISLLPGVRIKGDKEILVAPPSQLLKPLHWVQEDVFNQIAALPDWLSTLIYERLLKIKTKVSGSIFNNITTDSYTGLVQLTRVDESDNLSLKEDLLKDPVRFFNGAKFVPKRLADELMNMVNLRFSLERLWIYQGGIYRPEGTKVVEKMAQQLLNEAAQNNRINETLQYLKRETANDFPPQSLEFMNVRNGRLDWKNGILKPHDPNFFEVIQLPVEYDPAAICPNFERYLTSTLEPDVIPLLQEFIGYCLIPDTSFQKALIFSGTGRNGKSVLLNVVKALLGSINVSNVSLQQLESNKFMQAELVGKLANICADIDSAKIQSSGKFKMIVSGDTIQVERKNGHPFTFTNSARLIFSANQIPRCIDKTDAFYRRMLIVPFKKVFTGHAVDKDLTQKLVSSQELSGILNWAIQGLCRLYANGEFTKPKSVDKALREYISDNDSVIAFIEECAVVGARKMVVKDQLYQSYCKWCEEQGIKPISNINIKRTLERFYPNVKTSRPNPYGPRYWAGIGLIDEERQPTVDLKLVR